MPSLNLRAAAAPFLFLLVAAVGRIVSAQAGEGHTLIISVAEGYGIEDCLAAGGECGRAVANAWCEAHGHGAALAFGRADDVTDAISTAGAPQTDSPFIVRCSD